MSGLITAPGVYDIPAETYHRDPVEGGSLSSSGARRLLATCPARWKYEQDHPTPATDAMEFGTAVHTLVLGAGVAPVRVDADSWRTKDAREERTEAREAGAVALLPADYARAEAMAAAVRAHDVASALLSGDGIAEQTIVWADEADSLAPVWRRALLDWLPGTTGGRMILADYKTSRSAHPDEISRTIETFGYHQQAAWYADGVRALGLAEDVVFLLVVQETTAPYLITPVQIDAFAMEAGRWRNQRAIDIWRTCRETGTWPGYTTDIELIGLPGWAEKRHLEDVQS